MVNLPDDFDYATQDVFNAVRRLRNHITSLGNDECADAIACYCVLQHLGEAIKIMSPNNEDWPAKVIRFPIERRIG